MASNQNKFISKVSHSVERNAKPAIAEGHGCHSTSHIRVAAGSKYFESSHWPIIDLINRHSHTYPASTHLPASTSHGHGHPKPTAGEEDIELSAMPAGGRRINLHGSNMPQSLVAKTQNTCNGMEPMERFVAETYGQYTGKSTAAKPCL